MTKSTLASTLALLLALPVAGLFAADTPPALFTRTILQDQDIAAAGHHVVIAQVDFKKDAMVPAHTHPGEECGYLIEGTVIVAIAGQPPKTIKAGEAFVIPAGAVHSARNVTGGPARLVANYILEKGKPLATPVAAK